MRRNSQFSKNFKSESLHSAADVWNVNQEVASWMSWQPQCRLTCKVRQLFIRNEIKMTARTATNNQEAEVEPDPAIIRMEVVGSSGNGFQFRFQV